MIYIKKLRDYLENKGFYNIASVQEPNGSALLVARIETGSGSLMVLAGKDAVRITKPNGSVKWYYEKSNAQIARVIEQIMEFAG